MINLDSLLTEIKEFYSNFNTVGISADEERLYNMLEYAISLLINYKERVQALEKVGLDMLLCFAKTPNKSGDVLPDRIKWAEVLGEK